MKHFNVAIGIVLRGQQVLICRRRQEAHLGGFWEFPGGKVEANETAEQCIARELAEEVAITARPVELLAIIEHVYPDRTVRLHPFLCDYTSGDAKPLECDEIRWVEVAALREYQFPPANDTLLDELLRRQG